MEVLLYFIFIYFTYRKGNDKQTQHPLCFATYCWIWSCDLVHQIGICYPIWDASPAHGYGKDTCAACYHTHTCSKAQQHKNNLKIGKQKEQRCSTIYGREQGRPITLSAISVQSTESDEVTGSLMGSTGMVPYWQKHVPIQPSRTSKTTIYYILFFGLYIF